MLLSDYALFDAHFHIIDPRFPLVPNRGFLPDRYTTSDYLERMEDYDLRGGAVVSGSFQAFDQDYLVDALSRLGPSFAGVTQFPASISDAELRELDRAGVRAVRFNLKRGGSEDVSQLDRVARRVHELMGWHVELYVDSLELEALVPTLLNLPAPRSAVPASGSAKRRTSCGSPRRRGSHPAPGCRGVRRPRCPSGTPPFRPFSRR